MDMSIFSGQLPEKRDFLEKSSWKFQVSREFLEKLKKNSGKN